MLKEETVAAVEGWFGGYVDLDFLSKIPTWVYIAVATAYAYYKYCTWNFGTFKKLGISGPKPWPMVGTSHIFFSLGIQEHDVQMRKYGDVVGTFQGRTPILLVYDTEILKSIFVKEFANFTNRYALPIDGYAIRKLITILKDEEWKHTRNILTPTFSSGKLRKMNSHLQNSAETLCANLMEKAEKNEIFDFREICCAFTMDAIASVAFGLQIDSHNDPNNEFVRMGKKAFQFTFASPAMVIFFFLPFLMKPLCKLGVSIFPQDATKFFLRVTEKALAERKSGTEKVDMDFLQLMVIAHQGHESAVASADSVKKSGNKSESTKSEGLTHEEILANGLIFFLAGFETIANTLSLLGYSLATNPECQEKLLQEVDNTVKEHGRIDYDIVHKMPYLDMCVSETLRRYPAGIRTDRVAAEDITINGIFIPKGMTIGVPIYALHMDPEVWPEPTKFIPERFTAELKESRNPYSYVPFGAGPRSCIGNRLALTELKIAVVTILQKLKFSVCPETEIPLKLDKLTMKGVSGIKIRVEKR